MTLAPHDGRMRILTGGILAAFVMVLVMPGPAQAASAYHEQSSAYDSSTAKSATATCPTGEKAIGSGGWIKDGNGHVALTGIVPAPDLSSVTAVGRAMPGQVGSWSVNAVAICGVGLDPERVMDTGAATATAACPAGKIVSSTGYAVLAPAGGAYVDEVIPSNWMSFVEVHGVNAVAVVAYGICVEPMARAERTTVGSEPGSADSKDVTAGKPAMLQDFGSWIFGGGVKATGAMVDALVPSPTLDSARARAWRSMPRGPPRWQRRWAG